MRKFTFLMAILFVAAQVSAQTHNGHEYVDLGLSVMWATCNVGAENSEDAGGFFAWGEVEPKSEFTLENYTYADNPMILPDSADAATVHWGGNWRMPTIEEVEELKGCDQAWTSENGVVGCRLTANGNSIFLPAAGACDENGPFLIEEVCCFWSSMRIVSGKESTYENGRAAGFSFIDGDNGWGYNSRFNGVNIRPVVSNSDVVTAIENIQVEKAQVRKVMENGVIYIVHPNGEKFTLTGQKAK